MLKSLLTYFSIVLANVLPSEQNAQEDAMEESTTEGTMPGRAYAVIGRDC